MDDQAAALAAMREFVVTKAAGFLHNAVVDHRVTCSVCATPVDGYPRCYRCNEHAQAAGSSLADRTAMVTYGIKDTQSYYVMRQYKAPKPPRGHDTLVMSLAWIALNDHADCLSTIAGLPITHWAVVPSLPAKATEHPLHRLVKQIAPGADVSLRAAPASAPRSLNADHFEADPLPAGSHVILLDDTWTTGGHIQSAAMRLHACGASQVSALVMARFIVPSYGNNQEFIKSRLTADYRLDICPWTGADCP